MPDDRVPGAERSQPDGDSGIGAMNPRADQRSAFIRTGSGRFFDSEAAGVEEGNTGAVPTGDKVSLNFDGVEIKQVVEQILGRLLTTTYSMDPNISGKISFSTAAPVPSSELLPLLEMFLGWHDAVLINDGGIYRILPRAHAVRGNLRPQVGPVEPSLGYSVRAFPLRHVKPSAMRELILPFARQDAVLLAEDRRNLLVMSGTAKELRNYERAIDTFDVDWLSGMSVAMLPLEFAAPEVLVDELGKVLPVSGKSETRQKSPLDMGMLRLMPLQRLKAIVVITPQPEYLARVRDWVRRLDRPGYATRQPRSGQRSGSGEAWLYVHPVHNGKASVLAQTLRDVFGPPERTRLRGSSPADGEIAPRLEPTGISTAGESGGSLATNGNNPQNGLRLVSSRGIRITAVEDHNSLLIRATPAQYRAISTAIQRLDRIPLQVLVEARILEVTLSDSLNYGVRWFLESQSGSDFTSAQFGGVGLLASDAAGFSFAHAGGDAEVVIRALEEATQLKVLSAPSLMALNNKEANITVGDQIPIVTTQITTEDGGDPDTTTSEVQFRDTGVDLSVRPRVNPGGLVFMEIAQNVSDPGEIVGSTGNREIQQRSIETEIAVQSGDTIILGGLIRENETRSTTGVPFFKDLPLVGPLFGQNQSGSNRTELIVLLTPRVLENRVDAQRVTREYREQFERLKPMRHATNPAVDGQTTPDGDRIGELERETPDEGPDSVGREDNENE